MGLLRSSPVTRDACDSSLSTETAWIKFRSSRFVLDSSPPKLRIHQFIAIKKQFTPLTHNYHNQTFNGSYSSSGCLSSYKKAGSYSLSFSYGFLLFAGIQDRSSIGYLGRPLNIESTFRVSTGCAHGFGFFFFAGPSVVVIAILLIHITDVKTIVLLAKKLNSISRSGGDHDGRGGGRGGGGHEDHVGMEKKKNARDRKDVEWFVDGSGTILRITAILFN
ncbi:hypothetical protein Bca4012_041534 [Brassica carinata]